MKTTLLRTLCTLTLLTPGAFAATTWDANTGTTGAQDGGGTWDASTTADWWNGAADVVWPNTTSTTATIGATSGAAGTINVSGTVTLNAISFVAPGSGTTYTLGGSGTLSFGGTTPTISIAASQTPIINTILGESSAGTAIKFSATSSGSGSITLGGANTFSGSPTLSVVTINFNNLANGGTASSFGAGANTVPIILGAGASAAAASYTGGAAATDRPLTVNGTSTSLILNNNGTGAINFNNTGSAVSGTVGARTLNLKGSYTSAANTFAELLGDMGTGASVTALVVSGNTWNITGANTHSGGTTLGTSGVLNIGNSSALGSGTFTISGNGSFDNTTGGDISVNNAFTLSGGSPTYIGTANNMTINGATTISGANRTLTVTAKTLILGGAVGEDVSRSLTAAGSGTLALLGVNTYSGGTLISGTGTLLITNDTGLGSSSAGLTFSGSGALAATNNGATANNPVIIGSARTITVNSSKTANFITLDTNNLIIAAKITGAGAVSKKSSSGSLGIVRFGNDANDFTGDFSIGFGNAEFTSVNDQGTVSSLGQGAAGTGGQITLGNGGSAGSFRYVGTGNSTSHRPLNWTATTGGMALDNTNTGIIKYLNAGNLVSGSGAKTLTLQGGNTGANELAQVINEVGGATSVTKAGTGTWVLSGANTFTGPVKVTAGLLWITNNSALGVGPKSVTIQNGTDAELHLNGVSGNISFDSSFTFYTANPNGIGAIVNEAGNNTINGAIALTSGGSTLITVNGGTLTLAGGIGITNQSSRSLTLGGAGNGTVSGVISNGTFTSGSGLSLIKNGAGTWTLTSASTYGDITTIGNGTLALTGSASIANTTNLSIGAGAKLDVSGLSSIFTLGASQLLTGGGATGTINGNVNVGSGGLVLNYTNGTPTLTVSNGTLSFNSNAVTITIAGSPLVSGSYKLVSAGVGGLVSGALPAAVTVNGAGVATGARLQIVSGELYLVVDHPPVAASMTVTRTAGLSLKIALADVATNWSDGDGDAVSLTGINPVTTNGVNLSTNNAGFILYPNGLNVNDQFSYSINDGQGGTNTGVVNIVVVTGVSGQTQSITVIGSSATLSFAGIPAYTYNVQRSTNLAGWVTIWTTNAPGNGLFNYTDDFSDLGGVPPGSAYYRLGWQP